MNLIIVAILCTTSVFMVVFAKDLYSHKTELFQDKRKNILVSLFAPFLFFFATLGISDYALSTIFYRKLKLIKDVQLPGTLNVQGSLPCLLLSIAFIGSVEVEKFTLITCLVAQIFGSYLGPRFVVKLSAHTIRLFIGIGLVVASFFIIAGKLHLLPSGGSATELHGLKLGIAAVSLFIFGALNNIGIGSFAPTMVTIYALGMNPIVAFPIMMGSAALSLPVASIQFIKFEQYDRTIAFLISVFSCIGVALGVIFIQKIDISMLQWLVAVVLIYSGISMLLELIKSRKSSPAFV